MIFNVPFSDKIKIYNPNYKDEYSFPRIEQNDKEIDFIFPFKSDFDTYIRIITHHIEQQEKFISINHKLIPKITENFVKKR